MYHQMEVSYLGRGTPKIPLKRMGYEGEIPTQMDELEIPPFLETTIIPSSDVVVKGFGKMTPS